MNNTIYLVIVTSEVHYDGPMTEVVCAKTTRLAAEKVVAEKKEYINNLWGVTEETYEIDTDEKGIYDIHNDDGNSFGVYIEEIELTD